MPKNLIMLKQNLKKNVIFENDQMNIWSDCDLPNVRAPDQYKINMTNWH